MQNKSVFFVENNTYMALDSIMQIRIQGTRSTKKNMYETTWEKLSVQ